MPLSGTSRFELLAKLGEGGMGIVHEAQDRERDMRVALKTMRRLDASSLYQFKREFRALGDLSHPNIVALYELVSEGDDWFLVMELVAGTDFITHVHKPPAALAPPPAPLAPDQTPSTRDTRVIEAGAGQSPSSTHADILPVTRLDVDEVVHLDRLRTALAQLAHALQALHAQSMVHRDLKPSNVRVTPEGRVVLMDFGIVAQTRAPDQDGPARAIGTPAYMAPEQAAGKPPNAAADWYGFGVLLYQALTRRLPHDGANDQVMRAKQERDPLPPNAYVHGIPDDLERLCMRLLARQPAERPAGAEVLACLGEDAGLLGHPAAEPEDRAFVGRAEHLAALHAAYDAVAAGHSTCVVVEGPSGMGKSTLLHRFAGELREQGHGGTRPMLLIGRCHERESVPYNAFDSVIDSLSHELLALPDQVVEDLLPADIDLLTRLFPVLRRIPGVQAARPLSGANLPDLRARAVEAMRLLLDNLGTRQPVVMRITNLQWADRGSLGLLLDLLRPPAPRRLMILVSIRTDTRAFEELGPHSQLLQTLHTLLRREQCVSLQVGPLPPEEQALLVAALLRPGSAPGNGEAPPGTAWAHIQSESGGNPLFLTELARFVAELPEAEQRTRRVRLDDVVIQRFAQLPAHARALIQAVAVAGESLPQQLLATAAGLSSSERERATSTLRVRNWIRSNRSDRGSWLDVQHEKLREILLAHLPPAQQQRMHLHLAQALERWDEAPVPLLTRHWMAAGDQAQAARYLLSAARFAATRQAFDRAAALYRVALELQSEAPAHQHLALGDALAAAGRACEAAEAYAAAEAYDIARGSSEMALTLRRLRAEQLLRSGRIEQGMDALREVIARLEHQPGSPRWSSRWGRKSSSARGALGRLELALRGRGRRPPREPTPGHAAHLDALHTAAMVLAMSDPAQGAAMQARHLHAALQHGDEGRVCRALAMEATYLGAAGRKHARRAQAMSRDVTLRARKLGDPALIGLGHLSAGVGAFCAGHMRTTAEHCEDSLAALETVPGAEWERTTAHYLHCLALVHMGAWNSLEPTVPRAIHAAQQRSDVHAASLLGAQPNTWRLLVADRVADAHQSLNTALQGWPAGAFYLPHYQVALARAVIYLYEGDGAAAARILDRAEPGARRLSLMRVPLLASELMACRGRAALLVGDVATARRLARRLARQDTPGAPAQAALLEARLHLHAGHAHLAQRGLSTAIDGFDEQHAAHLEAACQHRLGQLLGGSAGDDLLAAAGRWMRGQGVANPGRMLALLTWSEPPGHGAAADRPRSPRSRRPAG